MLLDEHGGAIRYPSLDQRFTEEVFEDGSRSTDREGEPLPACRGRATPDIENVPNRGQPMSRGGHDPMAAACGGEHQRQWLIEVPVNIDRRFEDDLRVTGQHFEDRGLSMNRATRPVEVHGAPQADDVDEPVGQLRGDG